MAEQYKLNYFNSQGNAETIRFIFAYAGVKYEDKRYERDEWAIVKPSSKWGVLPTLNIGDVELGQSKAIARFLARKFDLVGKTPLEEAFADEIVDSFGDLAKEVRPVYHEQDPDKKAALMKVASEETVPAFLARLTKAKTENGGKWLTGNNVTWADLHIAISVELIEKRVGADALKPFPEVKAIQEQVYALPGIREWVQSRPQTDF